MNLTCSDFEKLVEKYLDCKVPQYQLLGFYAHLCVCEECRTYLYGYRKVVSLLREERTR